MGQYSIDCIPLHHLLENKPVDVKDMIGLYSEMWSVLLVTIDVTRHHIDLYLGSKQFPSRSYRMVPNSHEIEAYELHRTLKYKLMEHSQSEFSSPVLLVPKSDGSMHLDVD